MLEFICNLVKKQAKAAHLAAETVRGSEVRICWLRITGKSLKNFLTSLTLSMCSKVFLTRFFFQQSSDTIFP